MGGRQTGKTGSHHADIRFQLLGHPATTSTYMRAAGMLVTMVA